MTPEPIGVVVCDPEMRPELEACALSTIALEPVDHAHRRQGALEDLMIARWRGATHVVVADGAGGPTSDPNIFLYLGEHGTRIGEYCGGTLWRIPPPPEPGPPAVFCLGLTKTATTTLSEALGILGVRCLHWGGQDAWHAVMGAFRAGELLTARLPQGWDGYADIDSLLTRYRLLDVQYPGSRFILTVRDEEAWITSRRRHVERNRQAHASGRYQGTHLEIDEQAWRATWNAHLTSVRTYFSGRDDLLELDLTARPRWDELASFLDVDMPEVAFPAANIDGRASAAKYPSFSRRPPSATECADGAVPPAECPICATVAPGFERLGTGEDETEVRCGTCGSLERHRALWIFLVDRAALFDRPGRVLHLNADPIFDRLSRIDGFGVERLTPAIPSRALVGRPRRRDEHGPARTDLSDLDVADGTYDLVIASHVLHQIADDAKVLRELRRVIAPDGGLLVSVPTYGRPTDERSLRPFGRRRRRFADPSAIRAYGNDGVLERRMADAGFAVTVEDVPSSLEAHQRERFRLTRPELLRWATAPRERTGIGRSDRRAQRTDNGSSLR